MKDKIIESVISIAITAGKIIMGVRKKGFTYETKSHSFDFVTTADLKSEKYIISQLQNRFPKYTIISEEKGIISGKDKNYVWYVDPLDGTKDFKNNGKGFAVMIGLCYKNKPILGVVYGPAQKILYYGEKDKGSYVRINGKDSRLMVSDVADLKHSVMVTRIKDIEKRKGDIFEGLFKVKKKVPESSVGLKLGLIGRQKADFHIHANSRASKWDTCAPQIILEQAGGKITDIYGKNLYYAQSDNNWKYSFVASNKVLHDKIIAKTKKIRVT